MSAEIERLDTLRREFLQLLYEASGGSTTGGIQMLEIGSQLGLDDDECLEIVQWLVDRGRVRWFSMGGNISITPTGVDVAEAAHREVDRPSARSVAAQPSATTRPGAATGDAYDFDVFVSHASEDKDRFARPLFLELHGRGLRVWFDEAELRVGDSLTQKINDGLSRSRFGVVILSPAFFAKNWPQAELAGLANRHISSDEVVVLPVWLDITEAVLRQRAPLLTDLLALQASAGVTHVANGIEERVRGTSSRPQTVTRAVADAGQLDPMTVKGRFFPWGWSAVVGNDDGPSSLEPSSLRASRPHQSRSWERPSCKRSRRLSRDLHSKSCCSA